MTICSSFLHIDLHLELLVLPDPAVSLAAVLPDGAVSSSVLPEGVVSSSVLPEGVSLLTNSWVQPSRASNENTGTVSSLTSFYENWVQPRVVKKESGRPEHSSHDDGFEQKLTKTINDLMQEGNQAMMDIDSSTGKKRTVSDRGFVDDDEEQKRGLTLEEDDDGDL